MLTEDTQGLRLTGTLTYAPVQIFPARHFVIATCGPSCTLLIETDIVLDEQVDDFLPIPNDEEPTINTVELTDAELESGDAVVITIMFYYTQEYAQRISPTPPLDYVNQIVADINESFECTYLNIRVRAFCVRESSVSESSGNPSTILEAFKNSKQFTISELRHEVLC